MEEAPALAHLKKLVLERLMRYYQFVVEVAAGEPPQTVTSAQIAEALEIDPTQVRKDFAAIGIQGMGRIGFDSCDVCRAIRMALGFDHEYQAVLIGVGHLGTALLAYPGFRKYGLHIVAAFDNHPEKIGQVIGGCMIRSTMLMKSFIRERKIRLAIITTPSAVAQEIADRVVSVGVHAIWNFAPTHLVVPEDVLVRHEHISLGLAEITYHLKEETHAR